MKPYKDYVHSRRDTEESSEEIISGILAVACIGMILGIMLGMSI